MNDSTQSSVPILLWPFYAIWRLLTLILNLIGRVIGIPLASLGFLLLIRALF